MKKIFLISVIGLMLFAGIFVLAENATSVQNIQKKIKGNISVDPVCAKTAIDKRDTAIISSFDAYSVSVKSALNVRKDALKSSWDLTDKQARKEAIKAAWKNYSSSIKTARSTFNKVKKASWQQYRVDRQACGFALEDQMNSGVDATL